MRHQNNTKKGDTKQSFNIETRNKLEGLVDEYQKEHPKSRHSWRFPTQSWAEILSKDSSTIRRELNRGKSQQGDEDHRYFVYSAHNVKMGKLNMKPESFMPIRIAAIKEPEMKEIML